jgi:hypothetical protein
VKGHLVKGGKKVEDMTISGKWDEAIFATYPDGRKRELWRANPLHPPTQKQCDPPPLAVCVRDTFAVEGHRPGPQLTRNSALSPSSHTSQATALEVRKECEAEPCGMCPS